MWFVVALVLILARDGVSGLLIDVVLIGALISGLSFFFPPDSLPSRSTLPVKCLNCGNIDYVEDSLIVLALHRCTNCQATGGKVELSSGPA
jgi:hypothetical protein